MSLAAAVAALRTAAGFLVVLAFAAALVLLCLTGGLFAAARLLHGRLEQKWKTGDAP